MRNLSSLQIDGNLTVDTNILYVDSTNNRVGVGTASPANDILHVAGNIMMDGSILRMASSTTKLVLQNVGGSWNSLSAKGINIGDWNSDPSYGDILVGTYDFSIKDDALTSLVKVKNNGNVLIGTTTDAGYKLDVNGATRLNGNVTTGSASITSADYRAADVLYLTSDGDDVGANPIVFRHGPSGELMRIAYNGNVGIGTTSPAYKLDVNGTLRATTLYGNGSNLTNISSAATLTTARTLTIGNSAKSFNGSANVSWSLTEIQADYRVPNNTLRNNLGDPTTREAALFHGQFNNKFRFLAPTLQEESTDGVNWTTSTRATAAQLGDLMIGEGQGTSFGAIPTGSVGTYGGYRLTWDVVSSTGYVFLNELYIYNSTSGNPISITIEKYHNTNGWQVVCGPLTGNNWPGHFYIPHSGITYSNSTSQHSKVRITFESTHSSNTNQFSLYGIEWFGGYPQGRRNPEYYDRDKNVTFPAQISSLGSVNLGTGGSGSLYLNGVSVLSRTGTYTQIGNPEGAITLYLGDSADRTNYYDNNVHTFRNAGGGSTYAVINSSGNVGIGTLSPSYRLDVQDATNGIIRAYGGSIGRLSLQNSTRHYSLSVQGSSFYLYDEVGAATRMLVNSSGNVGIGTTSPNHKLDIYSNENVPLRIHRPSNANLNSSGAWGIGFSTRGDANTSTTDTRAGIFSYYNGNLFIATSTSDVVADPDASARLTVTSGGYVGLGTMSPARPLHVSSAATSVIADFQYTAAGYSTIQLTNTGGNVHVSSLNNDLLLSPGGTERARITNTGNVGIGTTSPSAPLAFGKSVYGAFDSENFFRIKFEDVGGTHNDVGIGQTASGSLGFNVTNGGSFIFNNGTGGESMRIVSGNVGIGTTSPAGPLHVKYSSSTLAGITIENDGVGFNAGSLTLRSGTSGGMNMSVTSGGGMYWYSLSNSSNALSLTSSNNLIINGAVDNGKKLQVNGDVFIKGSGSASSTRIFEVQNSNGTSIMDFRGDAYAFFGCGQGGGAASGFIFRYNDTSHVQFTGYNYGNGAGSYKPILLDTDLVGRGQGIYVNFGGTGYANPAPLSETEFAVRGRTADSSQKVAKFNDSNNNEVFSVRNDGALFTQGSQGWNGTINFPGNAPGQQNLQFVNGILTNVF